MYIIFIIVSSFYITLSLRSLEHQPGLVEHKCPADRCGDTAVFGIGFRFERAARREQTNRLELLGWSGRTRDSERIGRSSAPHDN